jgi:hypothetical protein
MKMTQTTMLTSQLCPFIQSRTPGSARCAQAPQPLRRLGRLVAEVALDGESHEQGDERDLDDRPRRISVRRVADRLTRTG